MNQTRKQWESTTVNCVAATDTELMPVAIVWTQITRVTKANAFQKVLKFFLTHLTLDTIDNIFRCISVNENFCILIKISLKFVLKGPIDNNSVLV